jgi:hypothetical protein
VDEDNAEARRLRGFQRRDKKWQFKKTKIEILVATDRLIYIKGAGFKAELECKSYYQYPMNPTTPILG